MFLAITLYRARDLVFVPPDAAHYGVVARNLLRGEGYTETFVPFHPATYGSVRHVPELHGLLRPLLLLPVFALVGPTPFALYVPGLVCVALTGLIVFAWGRRAFGPAAGLLACALTLTNPNLLWFSLLGTDDVSFALFFTATAALLHRGLVEERDRDFLLAGVVAGLALLEKLAGFGLLALFAAPLIRLRDRPHRVARWVGLLLFPFVVALSVYLVRNYVAYGSLQFRFGVFNWIGRLEGHEGWTRLYDRTPTLLGVWQTLGWSTVIAMAGTEVRRFADAIFRLGPLATGNPYAALMVPAFLPVVALAAIPLYARRKPAMTTVFVLGILGPVGLICFFYTALVRYFCMLVPLLALWVAGLLALGASFDRPGGRLLPGCAVAAGVIVLALSGHAFLATLGSVDAMNRVTRCDGAMRWIATATEPSDRIMTFDPWYVAWATDRETVMIPSGGSESIFTAGWRYKTRWILAWEARHRPRTSEVVMRLETSRNAPPMTTAFDDGGCRIYRVDWPPV